MFDMVYTFIIFNNVDLKNLSLLQLLTGLKTNIWFLIIFVLTVLVFNPLIVKFIIWLINETRKFMNLDCISLLDKERPSCLITTVNQYL